MVQVEDSPARRRTPGRAATPERDPRAVVREPRQTTVSRSSRRSQSAPSAAPPCRRPGPMRLRRRHRMRANPTCPEWGPFAGPATPSVPTASAVSSVSLVQFGQIPSGDRSAQHHATAGEQGQRLYDLSPHRGVGSVAWAPPRRPSPVSCPTPDPASGLMVLAAFDAGGRGLPARLPSRPPARCAVPAESPGNGNLVETGRGIPRRCARGVTGLPVVNDTAVPAPSWSMPRTDHRAVFDSVLVFCKGRDEKCWRIAFSATH
ncbi:hypothetical protein E143388_08136 [Rhodococcus opacus]|nr:hypothetical protein E143388_08136 [Rhodococcus opacus]